MDAQAIRIRQDGTTLYVTAIPAGELISRSEPDVFRVENGSEHGYQRAPERSRALLIARFLQRKQVLLPTAITLGARGQLRYDEQSGVLSVPDDMPLYEVDGQHRTAGFRVAIDEQGVQRLADFPLVAVIIEQTDEALEADQFRTINETAKKVRTDLARRILAKLSRVASLPLRRQMIAGRGWEVRATEVIEVLQQDASSPWHGRIQAPNQQKSGGHTIKEKSFGDSLQGLLTSYPFEDYRAESIAEGLNEFWRAWEQLMDEAPDADEYPDPFDDPQEFVLLKAIPGVFSQHRVCRYIWSVLERRRLPFEQASIRGALRAAGDVARGSDPEDDFTTRRAWHGQDGAFAFYGGLKGAKGLADLAIEYLNLAGYALETSEVAE